MFFLINQIRQIIIIKYFYIKNNWKINYLSIFF